MTREFLNRAHGRAAHGQMRTERVPEDVGSVVPEGRLACHTLHECHDHVGREGLPVRLRQHQRAFQVPMVLQRRQQSFLSSAERDPTGHPCSLRHVPASTCSTLT
jgi:hypothetical protein